MALLLKILLYQTNSRQLGPKLNLALKRIIKNKMNKFARWLYFRNKYSTGNGKVTKVICTLVISYTKIEVVVFFEVSSAKLIGVSGFVKIISSLSKANEWEIHKCSML